MRPVIIVDGGAGRIREEEWAELQEGCRGAALSGWQRLTQGGSALDAVEQAVAFLEDHPLFNAGRGSSLNAAGEGGIIAVDRTGRIGHAHNTPHMPCAFMDGTSQVPTLTP